MRSFRPRRPSPAMVVALIALFVALGGGAYAGVTLANNSVLSATIKNGEVRKADLANNAVTGGKIKDGEVKGADVGDGSLSGTDIADGSIADADIAGIAAAKVSGKVASAAAADTATNATNATSATNADKLDNLDSTQIKPSWVVVSAAGSVTRASNPSISVVHTATTGRYNVTFPSDVSGCAWVVALSNPATTPPTGQAETGNDTVNNNTVVVFTDNSAGTATDLPFALLVAC